MILSAFICSYLIYLCLPVYRKLCLLVYMFK
jgi:hypothetical protein